MRKQDPVLNAQIPLIRKIFEDEAWLEGERRKAPVSKDDPIVRNRACEIILRVGAQLRREAALLTARQGTL